MLIVDSSILLTTTPVLGDSTAMIALVLGIVALLFAFAAYAKARRASSGQPSGQASGQADSVNTSSAATAGSTAGYMAGSAATDDRQLVAVITAAISAVMASESDASDTSRIAVGSIRSIRRVAGPAMAAPTSTGSGPYAGFVVRRNRRV